MEKICGLAFPKKMQSPPLERKEFKYLKRNYSRIDSRIFSSVALVEKFTAHSIKAKWEYACGKFPSNFFVLKSISSLNKPK
jgi:hypothetical protein